MAEHTPDELLTVADKLAKTIVKLRHTCESLENPLTFALVLAVWVSAADSMRLGRLSPVCLTCPFVAVQLLLVHYAEDKWLKANGLHVLKVGGILYLIVSEHILGLRQCESPATSGIVFQHTPTYLALLCASNLREACITLSIYGVLLLPLVDTWWRYNEFLLHCCLVCFAAWIKGKLIDLLQQSEAFLDVRSMILDTSISEKQKEIARLGMSMEEKEKTNIAVTKQLRHLTCQYQQMSNIAEEAVMTMDWHYPRRTNSLT